MSASKTHKFFFLFTFLLLGGCKDISLRPPTNNTAPTLPTTARIAEPVSEQPVTVIPLAGQIAASQAEISGLTWYGNYLILLPQYPSRFGTKGAAAVFALPKTDILAFLDGETSQPLDLIKIPFISPELATMVRGYEGFESIAFIGDIAFLTIESKPGAMSGYLMTGEIKPDLSELRVDTNNLTEILPQADLSNMSDESIIAAGEYLVTIYEANGANVNPNPTAHIFDPVTLQTKETIPFPNIEYRVTDATSVDEAGRFWMINYFFTGDTKIKPATDILAEQFGEGPTHAQYDTVERLVEFQFSQTAITMTGTPPIQLEINDDHARNWEGIVRLDSRGFLLATDKYPETILGFVPLP
ncbi:MAG TPA: hypothetical protein ENI27_07280 [bacterium]|nr:hypothetical protein [bacterium]